MKAQTSIFTLFNWEFLEVMLKLNIISKSKEKKADCWHFIESFNLIRYFATKVPIVYW